MSLYHNELWRTIFRNPASTPSRVGNRLNHEYWNYVGDELETRRSRLDPFLGELKRDAYLKLVKRWAPREICGTVLKTDLFEEAFGADSLVPDLAEAADIVVGFDISDSITRVAKSKFEPGNGAFVAADVRELPFDDCSFDLIVSPSTLDHFEDHKDLSISLRELARVLKPSGRLIVSLDNRQNIGDPLLRVVNRLGCVPFYLGRSYTVKELQRELRAAGLDVRETTAILHNPRLFAVAGIAITRKLHWKPLQRLMEGLLQTTQALEHTRLRYFTGSFVVAMATRHEA